MKQSSTDYVKQNSPFIMVVIAIVSLGVGFFGGTQYQKNQRPTFGTNQTGARTYGQGTQNGTQRQAMGRMGGQPVSGEITKLDTSSITIKSKDGSSKIILLSENTKIQTMTEGSKADLKSGETVMIMGTTNTEGTITATTVSLGYQNK